MKNWSALRLIYQLLIGLSGGLSDELFYGLNIYGLNSGLRYGLAGGFLSLLLISRSARVQLTDRLTWSWKSLGRSLLSKRHVIATLQIMALIGLSIGLSYGLRNGLYNGLYNGPDSGPSSRLIYGLYNGLSSGLGSGLGSGLIYGLIYGLLIGLIQGVSSETIEDQHRVLPNQGISRSAFNSLVLGLISALPSGLISALFSTEQSHELAIYRLDWLSTALFAGLYGGLSLGLLAGLFTGGLACLRHYILRFLLWRDGSIPWHYVPFLDSAAERILLRKVGGGYIFLHRLLLDYFAARETAPMFNEPTERRQASTPVPVPPSNVPSELMVPAVLPDLSVPTISLAPPAALSETRHSLPCGHELHTPGARFCSVCGASITRPNTPT